MARYGNLINLIKSSVTPCIFLLAGKIETSRIDNLGEIKYCDKKERMRYYQVVMQQDNLHVTYKKKRCPLASCYTSLLLLGPPTTLPY